ncbi:MAG: 2,3-bisphosphoglycerate-independent phosphoglycerate mutase [Eubacteriaceae bacterium]|nr:2,3-bisphosphoglycerate-independent phosphoglycerate mutase [Eubacteriaceae bacterium]
MNSKVLLIILDGFAQADRVTGNAVLNADTPNLDLIFSKYPTVKIAASGLDVGLPKGQMGNSEVGHLNMGAGRIVYQDLTRITKSICDGDFFKNEEFLAAFDNVKMHNSKLHIMGLLGSGGVHSHTDHLQALLNAAKNNNISEVYIHCFTDGRDTPPKSGIVFLSELEDFIKNLGIGKIASVTGRFYAMDRDKRYDRLKLAYDALVYGKADVEADALKAISNSYKENVTDEFILPTLIGDNNFPAALIGKNDSVIFYNFRPDRARELTQALTQLDFNAFDTKYLDLCFVCMTEYDSSFKDVRVAFKSETIKNTLGEYISKNKLKQLRIAETEKYAHVTYFFNGGVETKFEGEDRILIQSPLVSTYDLKPEMSAYEVTAALIEELKKEYYDLIVLNYANCDMVGHTGIFEAAIKAVETVDDCVGKAVRQAKKSGYNILITADHGNAEQMLDEDNITSFTAHTANKVNLTLITKDNKLQLKPGRLADIAPTVLKIMNLGQPKEMTGECLITN